MNISPRLPSPLCLVSVTITTIGADHYFHLPDADRRTVALLATGLDLLNGRCGVPHRMLV